MTKDQYIRATRIIFPIYMIFYGYFILTLIGAMLTTGVTGSIIIQLVAAIFAVIVFITAFFIPGTPSE